MAINAEQARIELARRELERRQMAAAPEKPKDSGWKDFGQGLGASALSLGYGLKDLVGEVTPEQRARLEALKADAGESGWGTGGRVVGELAQLAIPGGAGLKAARLLSAVNKASKTAKVLPLASDVVGSAAIGAARLPGEGETRGDNATSEAAWALAGGVAEPILRTAVAGVRGTKEAARLRDMGVPLSAGQMLGGRARQVENIVGIMPFGAKPIEKLRAASDEGIRKVALREAAPPTPDSILTASPKKTSVASGGREARAQLEKAYEEAYSAAFTTADKLAANTPTDLMGVAVDGLEGLTKQGKRTINKAVNDIDSLVAANPNISVAQLDKVLRDNIIGKTKSRETDAVLAKMRQVLRSGQPAANQKALSELDSAYPKYVAVRNAVATPAAAKAGGDFGLDELATGSRQAATPYTRGTDKQPFMQFLDDANKVRGKVPTVLPTTSRRIIQALPDPLFAIGVTNRRIAGSGVGQKQARKILESELAKQLRYGVSGARLATTFEDEPE